MTKVQIISFENSAWYVFCFRKGYKNKSIIRITKMFENSIFTVFSQKLLATVRYINENIPKAQPGLWGQVEANQSHYYTSILMITRTNVQKFVLWSCTDNGTCKIGHYYHSIPKISQILIDGRIILEMQSQGFFLFQANKNVLKS